METVATMARENSGTSPKLRTYAGIRGVTLMRELVENGGATIDLSSPTLALADKGTGYYVGGATECLTAPVDAIDTRHMQYALKTVYAAAGGFGYFGVWSDGHTFYAEGSDWYGSREFALRIAKYRGQVAIYDIANKVDIYL
jgi:hypothetical protein